MISYRLRQYLWLAQSRAVWLLFAAAAGTAVWVAGQHPELAVDVAWTTLGCAIGLAWLAGWGIADWLVLWRHRRERIEPLGWAVRQQIHDYDDWPATAFIHWPADFGEADTEIHVYLPRGWNGSNLQRDALLRAVRERGRFAEDDITHGWPLHGRHPFLRVSPAVKRIIPRWVEQPDVADLLEESTSGHHLLALGPGGDPIRGDLDGKAPHVGVSMPTGEGKSNAIKGIVAQEMHLGASAVFLDYKRRSHKWAKGIEGVTYCRDIGEIHNALVRLAKEAMNRNVLADELGDDEEPPWQRRIVVMEEQNTTIKKLRRYWQQVRERDDPTVSPAIDAYEELLNMGRQVNVHVLACFQKLTAAAAGGTENRDQLGMVLVATPNKSTWKMLAGDLLLPDVAGKPKGRTWYVRGGQAPEGQAVLWTDKQAREWASSGASSRVRASRVDAVSQGKRPARRAGTPHLTVVDGGETQPLYTVREASTDFGVGVVPLTHSQLRGARSGDNADPEFPTHDAENGQKKLYSAETLQRYYRNSDRWVRVG